VNDDCDNIIPNALVVASFDNGDPPLTLVHIGSGRYEGTWQPSSAGQSTRTGAVRITVRANMPGLAPDEAQIGGQVSSTSANTPVLFAQGVVNAASYAKGEPLAPGSIISVFGANMANAAGGASTLPLPTSLGSASLSVAGRDIPLFYSSTGQINAHLPFDIPVNNRTQALLRVQGASLANSVPESLTIAAARPAIFTLNQQGTGQGAILLANSDVLAAPAGSVPGRAAQPATPGGHITIFCTGLGDVTNRPESGTAASGDPLSRTIATPSVSIGGLPATVSFSGLAPGFVGLYQVNVQVPGGVQPAPDVPLIITQDGIPSNTVTLAVQ
jgi:uncharacterized protein (TIGR03437 family)